MKSMIITLVAMLSGGTGIHAQESKTLVAYFSWSGNTRQVAEYIADAVGATLFSIGSVKLYPAEYKPCTEVAKTEKGNNARPEIKNRVADSADGIRRWVQRLGLPK